MGPMATCGASALAAPPPPEEPELVCPEQAKNASETTTRARRMDNSLTRSRSGRTAGFFHLQLRTLDVDDARSFYDAVLGDDAHDAHDAHGARGARGIVELPVQAVARGATPHWLGHLQVQDVDDAVAAFVKRGAMALGPKRVDAHGLEAAVVREPGGAVVALAKPGAMRGAADPRTEAVWYQLNTIDVDRAMEDYRTLFGWSFGAPIDGGEHGVFHPFAWRPGAPPVGWMTDIFRRTGRHPHWLFHFRVAALDAAVAAVRQGGGYVLGPFDLGRGERVAVCDDSQSAAFAIRAS